ncbi:MAG: hypothetical protein APF77_04170 [Clostridia bacterium BRH_c25]|nr:MAG: hypothetical protein APF77_04170 [Clostridia bacterium BRH_c25]
MYKFKSEALDKEISVGGNKSILEVFNQEGRAIYAPCGGKGTCGKCKVKVSGKINPLSDEESKLLTSQEISNGIRLACKTHAEGDIEVQLIEDKLTNGAKGKLGSGIQYAADPLICRKTEKLTAPTLDSGETVIDMLRGVLGAVKLDLNIIREISQKIDYTEEGSFVVWDNKIIDMAFGKTDNQLYGIAVDIGTTTVVCYLMDLRQGRQVGVSSMQNPQVGYGADVISRIQYTIENPEGLEILRTRIIRGIDLLIREVCEKTAVHKQDIYMGVFVGNTTMAHLFWGFDCSSLSRLPFNAVTQDMIVENSQNIGISNMNKNGRVIFLPGIAGFVGADTVGAMIAAELVNYDENSLLVDLGTNGEIVLSTSRGRYACSTAAGPAFEGARIKYGMQAFPGAIDHGAVEEDLEYTTIGDQPPRGICGSGLIDIVSGLLEAGVISEDGKIAEPEELKSSKLAGRIMKSGRTKEILIVDESLENNQSRITLTQKDIRELQLAKGAIRAGIDILLKVSGLTVDNVDRLLLAGAFGNFVNRESALKIGLFPDFHPDKIIPLGNAAGEGAKKALCSRAVLKEIALHYAQTTKHIEISSHPDFEKAFMEGMYFR